MAQEAPRAGLSRGPAKFFWKDGSRPSTVQANHIAELIFRLYSMCAWLQQRTGWRVQGTWSGEQPEEQPLFDPTGPQMGGDFDPGIRGGGHGLFSPLGHGVGGRSRRSRRVTTLPLHNARHPLSLVTAVPGLGSSNTFSARCGQQEIKGGVHTAMYGSLCCRPGGPSALAWRSGLGPRWWSPVRITGDLEGCFRLGSRRQAGGAERRTSAGEPEPGLDMLSLLMLRATARAGGGGHWWSAGGVE